MEWLKEYLAQRSKETGYGPMYEFIRLLNALSRITIDLEKSKLYFKHIGNYCGESSYNQETKELRLYYHVAGGGEYQYNNAIVDMTECKIKEIEGDCSNLVRKLFDMLPLLNVSTLQRFYGIYESYETISKAIWLKKNNKQIETDMITDSAIEKFEKLVKLHKNLLFALEGKELALRLGITERYWSNNIECMDNSLKRRGWTLYGRFADYELPRFEEITEGEIIVFPGTGRGDLCSLYLVVENFEALPELKKGDTFKLRNIRKGSKSKTYTFLEKNTYGYWAVRNAEGKIEFLTNSWDVACAYDALFTENKIIYKGWYNKRVKYVK